jgi:hypothetical protein
MGIHIRFTQFFLEAENSCEYDFVEVYDGDVNIDVNRFGRFCGEKVNFIASKVYEIYTATTDYRFERIFATRRNANGRFGRAKGFCCRVSLKRTRIGTACNCIAKYTTVARAGHQQSRLISATDILKHTDLLFVNLSLFILCFNYYLSALKIIANDSMLFYDRVSQLSSMVVLMIKKVYNSTTDRISMWYSRFFESFILSLTCTTLQFNVSIFPMDTWMSDLPDHIAARPICRLAIPGNIWMPTQCTRFETVHPNYLTKLP